MEPEGEAGLAAADHDDVVVIAVILRRCGQDARPTGYASMTMSLGETVTPQTSEGDSARDLHSRSPRSRPDNMHG